MIGHWEILLVTVPVAVTVPVFMVIGKLVIGEKVGARKSTSGSSSTRCDGHWLIGH